MPDDLDVRAASSGPFTIYYNGDCKVCSKEIETYRRSPGAEALNWVDVMRVDEAALGPDLTREGAHAEMHVRLEDGSLATAGAAFLAIWSRLPRFAWLARLFRGRVGEWTLNKGYRLLLTVWHP